MATYTPPSISNYNDNPPTDDGSENFTDNGVKWSRHIEEIGDPIQAYVDAVNSETDAAFDKIDTVTKRMDEFGADPTPGFDNKDAFEAAVVWLGAQTGPARLVFPGGRYEYSLSPNWAVQDAEIVAGGTVYLRYTGTANAFTLDGGAAGGGVYNMRVGKFIIEAPSTALDGIYMRAIQHSTIDMNVRGCGTSSNGLEMLWCVANKMYITVSLNETGSWYSSGKPLVGIELSRRGAGEESAYNTFINPLTEGCATGVNVDWAIGNQFYGGAFEGCTTIGLTLTTNSAWNKVFGTDLEQNGPSQVGPDIDCDGISNEFFAVDTFYQFTFTATAVGCRIFGGSHDDITVTSGADHCMINGAMYDRFSRGTPGVITDNGTDSIIKDCTSQAGDYIGDMGRAAWNDELILNTETLASGATYTNTTGTLETFAVENDQPITSVGFVRNATTHIISTTFGMWDLSPGDGITLVYPGSQPTILRYTR